MTRDQKINFIVVPITILIVGIVSLVLFLVAKHDVYWKYYLIGGLLGLMCHGLMIKQNARIARMSKLDPTETVFHPKKSAMLWYALRFVLVVTVLVVLGFLAPKDPREKFVISMLSALGGYLTLKIIFLIILLCFREKVVKE